MNTLMITIMFAATMAAGGNKANQTNISQPHKHDNMEYVYGNKKVVYVMQDGKDRINDKVVYVMQDGEWVPESAYTVFYGPDETVLTYAEYDESKRTFTLNPKQMRYDAAKYPEILKLPVRKQ